VVVISKLSLDLRRSINAHPFNCPFSGSTQVSRYQKGNTNLDFNEARDSEWQSHQLGHMQVCTFLQTDNHASAPPLNFLWAGCPSCRPANSVKALKARSVKLGHKQKLNVNLFFVFEHACLCVICIFESSQTVNCG